MTDWIHKKNKKCRACNSANLHQFLSLGNTPLANSHLKAETEFADEATFPLKVYFCENCSLVQLVDVVNPEVLFRHYIYLTGTSDTIAAHNVEYADTVCSMAGLTDSDLVVEIASNDGSLLHEFKKKGVRILGIEPAENIARMARESGIDTLPQFFGPESARAVKKKYGEARIILGNNVLAHVDQLRDFVGAARYLLHPDGYFIVEVPWLKPMIDRLEFDTIYHEHLCYFSISALLRLYESLGLSIVKIQQVNVHGGSIRVFAGHSNRHPNHGEEVLRFAETEMQAGLQDLQRFKRFARDVQHFREQMLGLLQDLRKQGKRVAGYGAPAKGNTLLNYCGIDTKLLPYTVDKNPLKVGTFTPGMHIPVRPVETVLQDQPDFLLILAWNFADEIMRQQQEYAQRGGQFIIPIPSPKIV